MTIFLTSILNFKLISLFLPMFLNFWLISLIIHVNDLRFFRNFQNLFLKSETMYVQQARTYVDPRGLNMNCNVLDALGLNFRTDFVTCEDCPTCSTCSSCLTCSTCLTWMNFLSVEQGCPHNGPKTEYFFKFRFWPDNFANWTIWKLWKKIFFGRKIFGRKIF